MANLGMTQKAKRSMEAWALCNPTIRGCICKIQGESCVQHWCEAGACLRLNETVKLGSGNPFPPSPDMKADIFPDKSRSSDSGDSRACSTKSRQETQTGFPESSPSGFLSAGDFLPHKLQQEKGQSPRVTVLNSKSGGILENIFFKGQKISHYECHTPEEPGGRQDMAREERFGEELSRASVPTPGSLARLLNICKHRQEQKDAVENGLRWRFCFLDRLSRSPGLLSRDAALHSCGIHHFAGGCVSLHSRQLLVSVCA